MSGSASFSSSSVRRAGFTRIDAEDPAGWKIVREEVDRRQLELPDRILALLGQLAHIQDGFAVDQLTHALQTAARAEADSASDELILAALCHDLGKVVSTYDHPAISAAILRPHVSAEVEWAIANHQLIALRHYGGAFGADREAWRTLEHHPHFPIAWKLVEAWDALAFDPAYPTPSLGHFEPLVRTWFGRRRPR